MAGEAASTDLGLTTPDAEAGRFRASTRGIVARAGVACLIAGAVLILPLLSTDTWSRRIALVAIFAIIGLSVNIITGHAGQISLGHQAFVGIGAFFSAFMFARAGFGVALVGAGAMGGVMALVLGLVALRVRGLYLALITLALGIMAQGTIFNWREFTGGGAGLVAPRPGNFESDTAYAYLTLIFLGLFLFIDWRMVRSKAGRAIVAFRNDERVAATLGVNVTGYKLLAFVVGGVVAGVAGSLFAHRAGAVQAESFDLNTALIWILMAVVGGLGSRAGVVIGSGFFALFQEVVPELYGKLPVGVRDAFIAIGVDEVTIIIVTPILGALLLILTLTLYPGGIGQQLLPVRRWLAGGPFLHHEGPSKKKTKDKKKEKGGRKAEGAQEPAQAAPKASSASPGKKGD